MKPRSLDIIADDINKLERSSIFDIGDLLIEAKAQCEHGKWAKWIWDNFEYAECTAQRYMQAATLATKSRTVRDLKISARTIYALAGEDEKYLPAIVKELAKHATKTRLTVADAEFSIDIGRGRALYPNDNLSDPALMYIGRFQPDRRIPWNYEFVAALRQQKPVTMEAANEILRGVEKQHRDTLEKKKAEKLAKKQAASDDADAILDGPPPDLPPPSLVPPEPQKLSVDDDELSAEAETFKAAVEQLAEAAAEGISERTLRRAKEDLCIRSTKAKGMLDGAWSWELPHLQ
jgi:hypothetical protein